LECANHKSSDSRWSERCTAVLSEFSLLPTNPAHPLWSVLRVRSRALCHRLAQNSILSRVKTMLIYIGIRDEKQRFEVIRGVHGIDQCVLQTPHDSNPVTEGHTIEWWTVVALFFGLTYN
jgi:hypothetical protein